MTTPRRRKAVEPVPLPPTPEQARVAAQEDHVRARLAARLAEMDAEIERLLAAARVASPMWIAGELRMWSDMKERRAGYEIALADVADAMREDRFTGDVNASGTKGETA